MVFLDQRMERRRDGAGYGQTVGIRGRGAVEAAKLGAVAVLIRSVGTSDDRLAHTGAMRYDDAVPKIPAAALSNPDADLLADLVRRGEGTGSGVSGSVVRFQLELGSRHLDDVPSANVIGEVVGRERPEEVVVLAAHLDSWDLGTGAIDDGAGCAIVIDAAHRILLRHLRLGRRRARGGWVHARSR